MRSSFMLVYWGLYALSELTTESNKGPAFLELVGITFRLVGIKYVILLINEVDTRIWQVRCSFKNF